MKPSLRMAFGKGTSVPFLFSQKKTVAEKLSAEWLITEPNGKSYKIKNLQKFCKENGKFCKENGLDQGNMVKVWKCVKLNT
jgi:hypothetical protein